MVETFPRYVMAGAAAALTHFSILIFGVECLRGDPVLWSAGGFVAAVGVNYPLQYSWTFRSTAKHAAAFPRYLVVTLTMLGLNTVVFWILAVGLSIWYLLSQALAIAIVMVLNFVLNRTYTFVPPAGRLP